MSAAITGKKNLVTKMGSSYKYRTKQLHTYTYCHTLHTQPMVASTWLDDHQGRPSSTRNGYCAIQIGIITLHMVEWRKI